jgi:hypothetical protein
MGIELRTIKKNEGSQQGGIYAPPQAAAMPPVSSVAGPLVILPPVIFPVVALSAVCADARPIPKFASVAMAITIAVAIVTTKSLDFIVII